MNVALDNKFKETIIDISKKLEAPKIICKATECINHYRTKGAACIRREIVIENGKCKHYEV